ncbi:hypothetical protein CEW91_07885 [Idiomarina piscisalsi]|jgi:hypothetical protein|uniref:ABC transmembrane type-1 domain-containing protein n=1 Tax=Idiomarina piscisalsi TaxID=1096243 RepID=A0ABN5AQ73_9GAMM|nr:hypothetical protein [Idiomarina piscisalsi]ASG66073.1 hypothetical protein CEW91_07885 [Idiomarina piscisalsi]
MESILDKLASLLDHASVVSAVLGVFVSLFSSYITTKAGLVQTVDKLMKLISKRLVNRDDETVRAYDRYSSVYGIMFARRMKEANFVSVTFSVFMVLYLSFSIFADKPIDSIIVFVSLVLLLLPWVKIAISAYRVSNGFLGNSEYEIRQFLKYIISEASDNDLNDGDGPRKLIDLDEFTIEKAHNFGKGGVAAHAKEVGV